VQLSKELIRKQVEFFYEAITSVDNEVVAEKVYNTLIKIQDEATTKKKDGIIAGMVRPTIIQHFVIAN
jgi:hypothetical protein